jgi:hypothetical protein
MVFKLMSVRQVCPASHPSMCLKILFFRTFSMGCFLGAEHSPRDSIGFLLILETSAYPGFLFL